MLQILRCPKRYQPIQGALPNRWVISSEGVTQEIRRIRPAQIRHDSYQECLRVRSICVLVSQNQVGHHVRSVIDQAVKRIITTARIVKLNVVTNDLTIVWHHRWRFWSWANVSSAGSLRAGQRVEPGLRVGIKVSHRRKERARRLASRAWFALGLVVVAVIADWKKPRQASRDGSRK